MTETPSIQSIMKENLMAQARNFDIEEVRKRADMTDTVTLYHGTNSVYLNSILENGIQPRNVTGNNNWEAEEALSNENIVYLSNKFHYFYAYNSTEKLLKEKYGERWSENPKAQWWLTFNPCPIYFTVTVPKEFLTIDEDIVYTKFVKDKIKASIKKGEDLTVRLTWEDSLAHQGTVGVKGGIPREWITSFTMLGDAQLYLNLMDEKAVYRKEHQKWLEGKGKGKLKLADLKAMEKKYKKVGTLPVKQLPKGYKVSQIYYNQDQQSMAVILNTPAEYLQQPNKLELI